MVFSQLSGHDSRHVAVLILPRLFNDRERLIDAPEPLEGLRSQDGDTTGIRGDRHDDVLLDLDVHCRTLPRRHFIEQLQATLCVAPKESLHGLHPNGVDIAASGRARAHGPRTKGLAVVDAGSGEACS
jgi:hypothetical protein